MGTMLGEASIEFLQKLAQKGLTMDDLKRNPTILQAITETKALDRPEPLSVLVPNIEEAKKGTVEAVSAPQHRTITVKVPIPFVPYTGEIPTTPTPTLAPTAGGVNILDWLKDNALVLGLVGVGAVIIARRR